MSKYYNFLGGVILLSAAFLHGADRVHAQTSCLGYPSNSVSPGGYAVSWDVFDPSKSLLVKTNCPPTGNALNLTVGRGAANQIVYNISYSYEAGRTPPWLAHTLTGTVSTTSWLQSTGTASLTAPLGTAPSNPYFFVGYVCTDRGAGGWKCGCENSSCSVGKWQLQSYIGNGAGTTGGTTGGTGGTTGSVALVGKSGMPWNAGSWINGGSDRMQQYTNMMGHEPDAVTQGMGQVTIWPNVGGADSEAEVDQDFNRTPAQWAASAPLFHGVFTDEGWFRHIWGGFPATVHRKRIINLDWAEPIPSTVGNRWNGSSYANPTIYKDIKEGDADKYVFLLGRKFAYLDKRDGDPDYPMTLDFFYEFTLETHGKSSEGSYTDGTGKHYTYQDFPYAWARWIRVFKEGYKYQRGFYPNYKFAFRPQLNFINSDRTGGGRTVRHEELWPNDVANWTVAERQINGVTVLPAGPIGRQIDLVGASWHDSSMEDVRGASATAPGNNWAKILNGSATYWGFNEIANFAQAKGVRMVFPEWAPMRGEAGRPPSQNPADVIRFTYAFFDAHKDLLDHENYFDQGSGSPYQPWPSNPSGQDPVPVYKALWRAR